MTLQPIPIQASDSNNNSYIVSNLNNKPFSPLLNGRNIEFSASALPLVNELTNLSQDINSNQHQTDQHYQPSTTTVNLSESNQSVYFMMQTSPLEFTATPLVVSNGTSNNLKLKSSPTSTPTVAKKLYSAKNLETANQIIGANVVSLASISSPVSSPPSSVNTSPNGSNKVVRDERRRANHNEG